MGELTIFKRNQALIGNFKLKWVEKGSWIIQNGNVCDIDCTHCSFFWLKKRETFTDELKTIKNET